MIKCTLFTDTKRRLFDMLTDVVDQLYFITDTKRRLFDMLTDVVDQLYFITDTKRQFVIPVIRQVLRLS